MPAVTRLDILEHLMRVTDPDTAVLADVAAQQHGWAAAVGLELPDPTIVLRSGTPLASKVTGCELFPRWRDLTPPRERSAWEELVFYRHLIVAGPSEDPLRELEQLRQRFMSDA